MSKLTLEEIRDEIGSLIKSAKSRRVDEQTVGEYMWYVLQILESMVAHLGQKEAGSGNES